jgi:hypothetical protein
MGPTEHILPEDWNQEKQDGVLSKKKDNRQCLET